MQPCIALHVQLKGQRVDCDSPAAAAEDLKLADTGAAPESDGDAEAGDLESSNGTEVVSATQAVSLMRSCSVVAALHPDQAAGHAISLALALRKPFAVIPCCVYAAEFPKRKLPTGKPVRTYEQLLDFLQAMHPLIRRAVMDFEGKRVVLYMTATDAAQSTEVTT
eukprot:gnl/TRDRNA2_/TRDRNA2_167571_c1_seq1.p1 gnl/TRDRNA2_/TRDRNA2_167571_c1~~gnl/TRDRNA2_/TRDRNA2_167571_c1_seq1.p1  ORF type:complete len:165 (+),score=19.03 gnl/TRDRNA2_/TRDRNA2_167571_c1_seq1:63-557(+)